LRQITSCIEKDQAEDNSVCRQPNSYFMTALG
jgi:hypothetical protein